MQLCQVNETLVPLQVELRRSTGDYVMKTNCNVLGPIGTPQLQPLNQNLAGAAPRLCVAKDDGDRDASVACRVSRTLNALSQVIGGQVLARPSIDAAASPAVHLPRADFLLVGTGLARPYVVEEAQELAELTGDSVAIIRVGQDDHLDRPFTVDILMAHTEHWVSRYIPWQIHTSSDLWFVPSQGEGRSFRVLPAGFLMSPRAPFSSLYEREYGFGLAMRSITNMMGAR